MTIPAAGRGSDRDEDSVRIRDALGKVGREAEPAGEPDPINASIEELAEDLDRP
jgi:hypothetical protein